MSKIRVLPEILANKIAAGEIIERPASVVKELLENSIDAGATSIQVSIQSGGKRLITVCDDGEGMGDEDAILAFEHHATSKIRSVDDLAAITTLGFRGEALPSIASISRLIMRTRPAGTEGAAPGTELELQGGVIRNVKPIAWDRGTEVVVRDLFFNVPARRKFLRSHETELGHITRLVTHYALAHPDMRFRLESDGRALLDVVPAGNLHDRVYQIFGEDFQKNLIELRGHADGISVEGFCSRPHEQRTNPYSQFFYINRRVVRDRVLASAVRQAYLNIIPASAYPIVFIFLQIPFDQVDVNAHPAKTEVRFRQQSLVHDLVRDSIQSALSSSTIIPSYRHRAGAWPQSGSSYGPGLPDSGVSSDPSLPGLALVSAALSGRASAHPGANPRELYCGYRR
jgi:DNA mismatch repair protein MutL